MAVTVIDPAAGVLTQAIAGLGEAAAEKIFSKGIREKEIRKDPALMQSLVPSIRAAQRGGPESLTAIAKGLGIGEDFLNEILAFAPTSEQATEEEFLLGGGAKIAASTVISKALLEGANAEAALKSGLPMLEAIAKARGLEFDAQNYAVQLDVLNYRVDNGIITTELKTEKIQAEIGLDAATRTQEFFNNFDQSTEEGRRMAMEFAFALENPAFLSHLGLHEQMDFQDQLGLAGASQSPADKIALSLDLQEAWNTAIDRFEEARESKDDDLIEVAVADVNNVRLMIQKANEANLIFDAIDTSVASLGRGFFGGLRADLILQQSRSQVGADFIENFLDQSKELEIVPTAAQLEKLLSSEAVIADPNLTPRIREQILEDFPGILEGLQDLETQDLGILSKGSVGGEVLRGVIARDPMVQAIGAGLSAISSLYTRLSEPIKAVLDAARTPVKSGPPGTAGTF